jgi:CubicO group peptidase (beta-lactamase class C family)
MRTDSLFRIASMTKPVTSAAVMMLIEEGRVQLDDPIARYIPSLGAKEVFAAFDFDDRSYTTRAAEREITVRHLLTHTSGLGYAWSSPILFALLGATPNNPSAASYPLLHDPGARWTYGESTRALGTLVETLTGRPLDVFLRDRVFGPLGMPDTSFDVPVDKASRLVTAHTRRASTFTEEPNPSGEIRGTVRGDGGLFSTAPDYVRFMQMILRRGVGPSGAPVLRPETVSLMAESHIGDLRVELQTAANTDRARPYPLGAGRDTFGLGFQITADHEDATRRAAGSLSWAGIYNTQFWIDPSREVCAVLLMQYLPFYDDLAIETLLGFEETLYRHLD